jgi:hypothetical protein
MTKESKSLPDGAVIGSGAKKSGDWKSGGKAGNGNQKGESKPGKTADTVKEDEKRKGLVDEDHPFPSKGN